MLATVAASMMMVGFLGTAWWWTAREAHAMSSMVQGVAQVGRAMTFDMGTAAFTGMWAMMMVAMMLPSIAPLALAHTKSGDRLVGSASGFAFLAGYFVIWIAIGLMALVALRGLSHVSHASLWFDRAGGAVLVVAGVYQFTHWKQRSIRAYRESLFGLVTNASGRDPMAAGRAGLREGVECLGCCLALVAVLVAVGIMSLVWMAVLTVIFVAEKNWRHGAGLTGLVGVVLVVLGLAVLLHPQFLTTLAPTM